MGRGSDRFSCQESTETYRMSRFQLLLFLVVFTLLRLGHSAGEFIASHWKHDVPSLTNWPRYPVYVSCRELPMTFTFTRAGNYRHVFPALAHICTINVEGHGGEVIIPDDFTKCSLRVASEILPVGKEAPYSMRLRWVRRETYDKTVEVTLHLFDSRSVSGFGLYLNFPGWRFQPAPIGRFGDTHLQKIHHRCLPRHDEAVDVKKDVFFLSVLSQFLTYEQMRRINRGIKERVYIPPSKIIIETLRLHFRTSLGASCSTTYNGRIVTLAENQNRPFGGTWYCSTRWQIRLFTMYIFNDGVYGVRCSGLKASQGLLLPESREINVDIVIGTEPEPTPEPAAAFTEAPAAAVVVNNELAVRLSFEGQQLVIPPQNSSAFFDVIVNPTTADITFQRTSPHDGSDEQIVVSTVSDGHKRVAFYHITAALSGDYRLTVTFEEQTLFREIKVIVAEKLTVLASPRRRAVSKGVAASLICRATGWPVPQVKWSTAIGLIPQSELVTVTIRTVPPKTAESVLYFSSPGYSNSSYYYCEGWNGVERERIEVIFDVYPIGSPYVDREFTAAGVTLPPDSNPEDGDDFELDLLSGDSPDVQESMSVHPGIIAVAVMGSLLVSCITVAVIAVVTQFFVKRRSRKRKSKEYSLLKNKREHDLQEGNVNVVAWSTSEETSTHSQSD